MTEGASHSNRAGLLADLVTVMGREVADRCTKVGSFAMFLGQTFYHLFRLPFRRKEIFQQMEFVGNQSINIMTLTSFFLGMAFALSIGPFFKLFKAEAIIGGASAISLARELAPVMTAFLLAGRAGAAMTAEIGTMKVNEQIDAMEAMAVDPISYLVVPRVIASVLITPFLTGIFMLVGVLASYLIGATLFDVDPGLFFQKIAWLTRPKDIVLGLQKSVIFAFVIATIACWYGLETRGGAKGVGRATTQSVVTTLLAILGCDFLITYVQLVK